MAQTWIDNTYKAGHVAATDLQNIKSNFAALKSLFLGTSSPASMAAGHPWFDSTNHVMKVRDDDNSEWWGLMHGDTSQKVWVYRNSAMNGWAVDSSVTDKVLALKGGSNAYDRSGGGTAGSWTQPDHSHSGSTGYAGSHNHKWYDSKGDEEHDHVYNSNGNPVDVDPITKYAGGPGGDDDYYFIMVSNTEYTAQALRDSYTNDVSNHNHSVSTNGNAPSSTWRPAAAVGTLQYLDL